MRSIFWRRRSFQVVLLAVAQFTALTTVAMLIYPGGTSNDKTTAGYSFFTNYFSDLGLTVAHNAQPNPWSMPLFMIALTLAGAGLGLFFIAFTQFFRHNLASKTLSWLGTVIGLGAAACFVGVAWTPADVFRAMHGTFVLNAFGLFFAAASVYCLAMLVERDYPSRYAMIFFGFAVLLGTYLWLITQAPRNMPESTLIQATGQKIIVYAALFSIAAQSWAALHVNAKRHAASADAAEPAEAQPTATEPAIAE